MKTMWIVVADEAIARIVELDRREKVLKPVEEIADPDAHASEAELRRDAQGRRNPGGAASGPGTVTSSASEDPSLQHAEVFAKKVADWLRQAHGQQRFEELTVFAAPRFLGLLRKAFDKNLTAAVVRDEPKDYVHFTNDAIYGVLFPAA
ncbi:host attachment protein [Cupriavidus agavae]|uniref:Protein required for attachment to host cells n=1 Tax=Cupriavidus agavae TaxID=1001822 RepID=A0A4Q7RV92_9BURK|nr:host attachment protein [Cupriavidus agavae]RZT36897.1 protein required for attachment to host cells [Cupriavidus agavae]